MSRTKLAFFAAFAALAVAQETVTTTTTANTPSQSLIPTGISSTCSTFLDKLNGDERISSCLNTLVDATAAFDPANATTTTGPESSALTQTLNVICANSFQSCSESSIRSNLAQFYTNCQQDLLGPSANTVVQTMYDVLYILIPLRGAVCAKDASTNKFCVTQITPGSNTTTTTTAVNQKRQEVPDIANNGQQSPLAILPDTEAYRNTSLPYLFISPSYSPDQLCTPCTKAVLEPYVRFEAATPHALGLNHSPILQGQLQLWEAMNKNCPADFTQSIMNDANVIGNTPTTGGATRIGLNTPIVLTAAFLAIVTSL